jgi:homoserine acetyltransferase
MGAAATKSPPPGGLLHSFSKLDYIGCLVFVDKLIMSTVFASLLVALLSFAAQAADYPAPAQGDHVISNFHFTSGETLPELRIHCWTRRATTSSSPTMLYFMGSNPVLRQQQAPTLAATDDALEAYVDTGMRTTDANDLLYQLEASRDYDPGPALEKIEAPLIAVNSADDLINPPELGILEREIKRVKRGQAVVLPVSPATRGHGSHTVAELWKQYLEKLLAN